MADLILGSEVSEFLVNRQTAKITYLQQENYQLLEQVKDLERALMLNKDILKITFDYTKQNDNNSGDTTNTSNEVINKTIIQKLHDENSHLAQQLQKMNDGRNVAQNKVLLSSQIAEENQAFYKDLISDLDEKIQELRRIIQDKEYAIQEIELHKIVPDHDGQMIKIREIVTPNEQSLRLHEELESTRQILNKISTESQNITDQNNLLKEINFNFKRELIKLRIVLRSNVAFYKMKEFIYDDVYGNTDDNLELQNEIYANPGYILNDYNHEHLETIKQGQVPDKSPDVLNQYGYKQTMNQQQMKYLSNNERAIYQDKIQKSESMLKGFKELFEREKNKNQLLSTRFNELQRNYINVEEINNTVLKAIKLKEEKLKKVQGELSYYRKQYSNYLNLLTNKREVNLNMSFEKPQANRASFESAKQEFKAKFMSQTPQNQNGRKPLIQVLKVEESKNTIISQANEDENEEKIEINVSILENDDDVVQNLQISDKDENNNQEDEDSQDNDSVHALDFNKKSKFKGLTIKTDQEYYNSGQKHTTTTKNKVSQKQSKTFSQYEMTATECKQFLLNSAKQLYLTYNLRMNNLQRKELLNQDLGQVWNKPLPIWHQKSSSDPLDYFTLNFYDLQLKQQTVRNHEDDFLHKELDNKKPKQKKQISNNPFYLDVSLIQNRQESLKKIKTKKVQINVDVSFISNGDNVLDGINQ